MEGLTIAFVIVSVILFIALCGVTYLYFQDEKQLAAAVLALASEKANAALAAQTASATLAAETLAAAQSKSAALQAAQIAAQNALTKQQTDDAVALAQAVAAQQAIDQTKLHEALANQASQHTSALKAAVEAQKQTDKEAMAAAIEAQKKTDLDAKVAAMAQQANQHASELASALLEQKNKAAKEQADAIAAAVSQQQTIDAKKLTEALAQAKKTADDAQAAAIAAQKSTDAAAAVTAATVAVVTAAQATALAAVNTTNAILIQILTAYQNTLNAIYTQSMVLAIYRKKRVFLPINSSYDMLVPHIEKNIYHTNNTYHMAAFLLGEINMNYVTQFQAYQNTAISQYVNTTKATTPNMATAAANAAVAASITASGLSTNVINMFNTIMKIITETTFGSRFTDKNNINLLMQTVGLSEIKSIIYESMGDIQKLYSYGPGVLNYAVADVPYYIASITPIKVQNGTNIKYLELSNAQIGLIKGYISGFASTRHLKSGFTGELVEILPPPDQYITNPITLVIHNALVDERYNNVGEYLSFAVQNALSITAAPGVTSDGRGVIIITDKEAAQKSATAAMLATVLNMRRIVSATLTFLNMSYKYILNDTEIILGIINGTVVYATLKNLNDYLDNIPKYSLEVALSLSKDQIGTVTDITNHPVNYVPTSINLWTEFGNRFITKSGGFTKSGLSNNVPNNMKGMYEQFLKPIINNIKNAIQEAIDCATKANELISPDIPLGKLLRKSPCDYSAVLENIQKHIIKYEEIKYLLFNYLISINQPTI